ncbi:hypothetical protein [Burkholderia ubonensis]|uniref:hypothetical protein n=1 Tax=Burkholderia TaxID=32008 RepID=UPI0039F5BABA
MLGALVARCNDRGGTWWRLVQRVPVACVAAPARRHDRRAGRRRRDRSARRLGLGHRAGARPACPARAARRATSAVRRAGREPHVRVPVHRRTARPRGRACAPEPLRQPGRDPARVPPRARALPASGRSSSAASRGRCCGARIATRTRRFSPRQPTRSAGRRRLRVRPLAAIRAGRLVAREPAVRGAHAARGVRVAGQGALLGRQSRGPPSPTRSPSSARTSCRSSGRCRSTCGRAPARASLRGATGRAARALLLLMGDAGLRIAEAAAVARPALELHPADGEIPATWELRVIGGNKERFVPIGVACVDALRAHWRDRGQDFDAPGASVPPGMPLIAPLVIYMQMPDAPDQLAYRSTLVPCPHCHWRPMDRFPLHLSTGREPTMSHVLLLRCDARWRLGARVGVFASGSMDVVLQPPQARAVQDICRARAFHALWRRVTKVLETGHIGHRIARTFERTPKGAVRFVVEVARHARSGAG